MKTKNTFLLFLLLSLLLVLFVPARAQAPTPTATLNAPYVIVTYEEEINVRAGPGTLYPIVGKLSPGATAPALGVSPGKIWVQIAYPGAPEGKGWVHSTLVQLVTTRELPVIQPPPTPTPRITATIDPTLMAAFHFEPTATRLPTFTPAPPVIIPSFTAPGTENPVNGATGIYIVGFSLLGLLGFALSARRK
uniref:SH3b domain-containing protein n=1 Tax=uncultured Chloroflexota bacterium TaxID=166587 RepID=H5SM42_9CHLR|nr:hypothetical protein HGMM_F48D12C27 [uncultured Chloroflexota bacterium]BAL58046.1 hypothetical protein HGMM_F54B02C11 [uncultured Chloroflexota bacterium]